MFRQMRRFKQLLTEEETENILRSVFSGTLALHGDEGYPYAVPMNFVYANGNIYFHSALSGHKADSIKRNDKACFSVVSRADNLPEKLTALYKSVTVFGRISFIEDAAEKRNAIYMLAKKYSPDLSEEAIQEEIDGSFSRLGMLKLQIEHKTGKQSIELTKE